MIEGISAVIRNGGGLNGLRDGHKKVPYCRSGQASP
jgi:hypothetical protein